VDRMRAGMPAVREGRDVASVFESCWRERMVALGENTPRKGKPVGGVLRGVPAGFGDLVGVGGVFGGGEPFVLDEVLDAFEEAEGAFGFSEVFFVEVFVGECVAGFVAVFAEDFEDDGACVFGSHCWSFACWTGVRCVDGIVADRRG